MVVGVLFFTAFVCLRCRYHEFAAVVMASLQPEEEEPKGKRKRKKSRGSVSQAKFGQDSAMFETYVSHLRIDSDKKLLSG